MKPIPEPNPPHAGTAGPQHSKERPREPAEWSG
jgi:hypothetical protein